MDLRDKVVVITGAGSGIGQGFAAGFCADGAQVLGFGRTEARLRETAETLGQGRMQWVAGDLRRGEDVERLFAEAHERYGRVDVLLNNAALHDQDSFLQTAMEDWIATVEVNLVGLARCCHLALPGMLERGLGRIINVGSFAWMGPVHKSSAYSASKGAVSSFTRALAAEIDRAVHPDVLVNELVPGVFRTGMSMSGGDPREAYAHAKALATLPAGGPTGQVYFGSEPHFGFGMRARMKRSAWRLKGALGLNA